MYFSFVAAPALFAGLPVDAAGHAVGLLFPSFFRLCTVLAAAGWLLYTWHGRVSGVFRGRAHRAGHVFLGIGTVVSLANLFVLLPVIESLERVMGPVSHADPTLLHRFGMYHGLSMLLDLVCILSAALVWLCLAWQTASRRPEAEV